jgi:leucyl aminopeptidase
MRIEVESLAPAEVAADVLVVPVSEPPGPLAGAAAELDQRLEGRLSRLVEEGEASGKLWSAPLVHLDGQLKAERLAPAGLGPRDEIDADAIRTAAAAVVRASESFSSTLAWLVDESLPLPTAEQATAAVEGVLLGGYDPGRWKSKAEQPHKLEHLVVCADAGVEDVVARAECVARWANTARDYANEPANLLTPERLADHAAEVSSSAAHLSTESLDFDGIRELGMGAFAGVAQGSHNPPRLIVMRYEPPAATGDVVLGLVGKGLTFDTGGISIKNALYMEDMKGDMAGGGAVVAAMGALAELEIPLRVIAVVGATENAVGGGAFRPGDILTAMNGKTIEVINTDAEGRLVLADALAYARQLGATHLLDLATLTGAMERAMGDFYAGVFANDPEWQLQVVGAGEASGDHAWAWPLHPRYRRYVDSHFADLKNVNIRGQGAPVYAAEFLREFAGDGLWAHIDMAGTGFLTWPRHDYYWQKGGTGYGVRLICELARNLSA